MMLRPDAIFAQSQPLLQKKIPSSGESIPIIGIGTARRYEDVKNDAEKGPLRETIRQFQALGGKVIDSSPSYGTAEAVVGELADGLKVRDSLFLATKVSLRNVGREEGIKQIEESFKKLRTSKIDLIAVHNLRDTDTQLRTLREMKKAGRIRYVGITTSFDNQYGEFEQVMKKETLDFIQVDYALDNRDAGERIIPLAGDRGMAVMINLPFGRGRLIQGGAGQEAARMGERVRLPVVAAVFSQVHRVSPGDHLRGSRHGAPRVRRRQPGRGARPSARRRHAAQDGAVHRQCLKYEDAAGEE